MAFVAAFATISYLHIVLGELAPKSAALRMPEAMSLWTAVPLFAFYWLMFPFIWFLNHSANALLRRFGLHTAPGHGHEAPYTLDELRMILHLSHGAAETEPRPDEEMNRMLAHTLELPDLHASDVMRNRRELASISNRDEAAAVRRTLQYHRFSRYPYFDPEQDDYIGVLHHKDIVFEHPGEEYQARLRRHLRPIERSRQDSPISDLLRQFRLGAPHLALVVDSDDRTIGFVTMEDVLEAIFGEILDEHEQTRVHQIRREPRWLDDERMLVRGDTPLFMVERELRIDLPDSETVSTVTGLLMSQLGHVPQVGDTVEVGYRASVLRATGAAIESVQFAPIAG
ncbi:MAG: hemolysin family protein [Rhodoglobus sp.]|nr:hemolysin family protein [Rhodoglobus sp.]